MTISTAPRHKSAPMYVRYPIPDRLTFLNRALTRIESFAFTGPLTKLGPRRYSVPLLITCKQGQIPWVPQLYFHYGHGWRISGAWNVPTYAMHLIRAAIFARALSFINSSEEPTIATVVAHGSPGRWQWKITCCPICHKTHFHGAGDQVEPGLLGRRRAHCLDTDLAKLRITWRPGYLLEEAL